MTMSAKAQILAQKWSVRPWRPGLPCQLGRRVNDGENKVFPIQVSRQELLLFLGAVIVIGTYKNIVLYECPSAYKCKFLHLWAIVVISHCLVTFPTQNRN